MLSIPSFHRRWYHGKLDRTIAEERLRQARNPGSYLIRESDRRPGSFVLSFLSVTNGVNHFRYERVHAASRNGVVSALCLFRKNMCVALFDPPIVGEL